MLKINIYSFYLYIKYFKGQFNKKNYIYKNKGKSKKCKKRMFNIFT